MTIKIEIAEEERQNYVKNFVSRYEEDMEAMDNEDISFEIGDDFIAQYHNACNEIAKEIIDYYEKNKVDN